MEDAKGRRSRKWNSDRYPKAVTVRVTLEEHARIQKRARRARLSDSRYLVRRGLSQRLPPLSDRTPPSEEERRELEFLLFELRKIGTNLNQLAHRANAAALLGRTSPPKGRVEQVATMVEGMLRLILKRL